MTIRYHCVECDAAMKIKDEKAGTTGHCPKCKAEFIVPAPNSDESADATVDAKVESAVEASDAPPKTPEEIAEDEYQAILMGDSPKGKHSRAKPVESDLDDDSPSAGRAGSDFGSSPMNEPVTAKPRARTTAEISAALMTKGSGSSEPTMKKTGKAFGEANTENEGIKAKAAREARLYYAKQIAVGGIGFLVIFSGMYWLVMSGFSGAKLPPLGRVSGTVKLDGKPLPAASVLFQPMQEGNKPRSKADSVAGSTGITDKNGHYDLIYVENVKGAVVGKHIVQIRALNDVGIEVVPPKYNHNTELTREVKGSNQPMDFELTSN